MIHTVGSNRCSCPMYKIIQTKTFKDWRENLKDRHALMRINARIIRMEGGNLGDFKPLREGVSELRIDWGPGYRVYFTLRGPLVIVLLVGGDKRTQEADIDRAIDMAKNWRE